VTNPFTVIKSPCSWSSPLCWLVLWNWVLEPSLNIHVIHICNIRLRVHTFLLMFSDSLAGKAFLTRSIKLYLVDNQRSSSVAIAGFESCWFEVGSSDLHKSNLPDTSRKCHHQLCYRSNKHYSLFLKKYFFDPVTYEDAYKHERALNTRTHTHIPMSTQKNQVGSTNLEIDKVIIDVSLSTDTSPTLLECVSRIILNLTNFTEHLWHKNKHIIKKYCMVYLMILIWCHKSWCSFFKIWLKF